MPPRVNWESAQAHLGRCPVSSTHRAPRAQQIMHAEQQPALSSSAPSPAPVTAALRRFFFGTSSDVGANGRMDKWTIVEEGAEEGSCVGNDSSGGRNYFGGRHDAHTEKTHCQENPRPAVFYPSKVS